MLLIFDTHPVQYRVPVWRELNNRRFGSIHVAYATDCSVKGHLDTGFQREITWDEPMLEGYPWKVLSSHNGNPLSGWNSLTGRGVAEVIMQSRPDHILLTGLNYRYHLCALLEARKRNIPVWLRCETQDEAFPRSGAKAILRRNVYRMAYRKIDLFFYIGELNRRHYLSHGVSRKKLRPARYATVDRLQDLEAGDKQTIREHRRVLAGVPSDAFVIGFSGKFIHKKNPELMFRMVECLPESVRKHAHLYFVGSGDLEGELQRQALDLEIATGVRTYFAGFVNQQEIARHYLAMDCLVLPSRRMGETWGLVCNEAMQAGCSVVVSSAVGCSADFKDWERFRVFSGDCAQEAARCVAQLAGMPRSFDWARERLVRSYSVETTASALLEEISHPSQAMSCG